MEINRVVKGNLSQFRELSKAGEYPVLLDCNSGEMKLPKGIGDLDLSLYSKKGTSSKAWKEIQIIVDKTSGTTHFKVQNLEKGVSVSSEAKRVVEETLNALNNKIKKVASTVLQGDIEKDPCWGGILTDTEAEEILTGRPIGTYLIRKEKTKPLMVEIMEREQNCPIQPYYFVFVSDVDQFSEVLLLNFPWGWVRYQDEPDLGSSLYPRGVSAEKLVETLKSDLPKP
jgi:hypothetical protein